MGRSDKSKKKTCHKDLYRDCERARICEYRVVGRLVNRGQVGQGNHSHSLGAMGAKKKLGGGNLRDINTISASVAILYLLDPMDFGSGPHRPTDFRCCHG